MPGYGHGSRPEWGIQILKCLLSRKQFHSPPPSAPPHPILTAIPRLRTVQIHPSLRRFRCAFILIEATHVDKTRDEPWQLETVFSVLHEMITDEKQRLGTSALSEIIGTAGDPPKKGAQRIGISDLR
ncbi:hypothetical protein BDZ91DRAFT_713581, partial [Kalaharituber pfeilii]